MDQRQGTASSTAVSRIEAMALTVKPPELPDAAAFRAAALASRDPIRFATDWANRIYDAARGGVRPQVERMREQLARQRARLEREDDLAERELFERCDRTHIAFEKPSPLTRKERIDLVTYLLLLVALLAASIVVISMILLDNGVLQSEARAFMFAIVPAAGSLLLARFASDSDSKSEARRARRIINAVSLLLLAAWVPLFVFVFGTGATESLDGSIDRLVAGVVKPAAPGGSPLERAFLIVALAFEVFGGATLKGVIDQLRSRGERPVPVKSAHRIALEGELDQVSERRCRIEQADGALLARLEEIDAGRHAFVEEMRALLHAPPATTPERPIPIMTKAPSTAQTNGRTSP